MCTFSRTHRNDGVEPNRPTLRAVSALPDYSARDSLANAFDIPYCGKLLLWPTVTASKQGCVQSYLVPLKDTPGSSERSPAFPERPTSNDQFPAVPISE
uniref:Uncharacterized protein n=1 Tax=Vespula pensylvanica TaxID=30213 RepID=A0A834P563_VESPE|nr:hypothetical protein H0235_005657 [Vespula pensylvanica]